VIPALDSSVLKRQLNLSPGLAKIAPYLPCHRDSFLAKVPGLVAGWLRQVTLTAHTRWPLPHILTRVNPTYMEISCRNMSIEETEQLKRQLISTWGLIEKTGIKWVALTILTILPLLIFEKSISSQNQLIIISIEQLIVVSMILLWNKKDPEFLHNKTLKSEIYFGDVEMVNIKSNKVIIRKDSEDFGMGYYFDLGDKTLFLQAQHLDVLNHSKKFPNTDFEIIRTKRHKILIDYKIKGEYLKPVKMLKAFAKEQYKSGDFHYDGQVLDLKIDHLK